MTRGSNHSTLSPTVCRPRRDNFKRAAGFSQRQAGCKCSCLACCFGWRWIRGRTSGFTTDTAARITPAPSNCWLKAKRMLLFPLRLPSLFPGVSVCCHCLRRNATRCLGRLFSYPSPAGHRWPEQVFLPPGLYIRHQAELVGRDLPQQAFAATLGNIEQDVRVRLIPNSLKNGTDSTLKP